MEAIGVEDETVLDQQLDGVRTLRARTPAVGAPTSALFDHRDRLLHHLDFFVAPEVARDLVMIAVTFHHMAMGENRLDRFWKTLGDGSACQECRLDVLFLQNPQQPINGMVWAVFALAPHFIIEDAVVVRLHVFAALEIEGQKYGGTLPARPMDEMIVVIFLEHVVSPLRNLGRASDTAPERDQSHLRLCRGSLVGHSAADGRGSRNLAFAVLNSDERLSGANFLRSALTDFTHLHHDGRVVMGSVRGERTAAHSDWLADQTAERGPQLSSAGKTWIVRVLLTASSGASASRQALDVSRRMYGFSGRPAASRALPIVSCPSTLCPSTFAFRHSAAADVASGANTEQIN